MSTTFSMTVRVAIGSDGRLSLLPGVTVDASLHITDTPTTFLPDNLTVTGDVFIRGKVATTLPSNLTIWGNLYLTDTSIADLPDSLTVRGQVIGFQQSRILPFKNPLAAA